MFSDINLQNDVQVFKLLFCLLLLLFNNFPSINNKLKPCLWQGLIKKIYLKSNRKGVPQKIHDVWAPWSPVQKLYNFTQNNCVGHTSREWPCPSQRASTIANKTCQTHALAPKQLKSAQWKTPSTGKSLTKFTFQLYNAVDITQYMLLLLLLLRAKKKILIYGTYICFDVTYICHKIFNVPTNLLQLMQEKSGYLIKFPDR